MLKEGKIVGLSVMNMKSAVVVVVVPRTERVAREGHLAGCGGW